MENKIVKDFEIIENMKKEKEKGKKIFYILTISLVVVIPVGIAKKDFINIAIMFGVVYIFFLIGYFLRNKNFEKKIQDVKDNSIEINNYCIEIYQNMYATKESIMYFCGGFSSNFIIKRNEIESFHIIHSNDSVDTIVIKTKSKKKYSVSYSKQLEDILINKNEQVKIEPKVLSSDLVKNFCMYDGYSEGIVDVPCLNTECDIFVYSSDDKSLKYAEETARKIKQFTFNDLKDAIICSIWAYRDYLKEFGYEFLEEKDRIPIDVTEDKILNYMTLTNVVSEDNGVCFQFAVPWEEEHGLSWVFRGKELIYVGSGHDVYPTSQDNVLQGNWNYAKKYHQSVEFTEEERTKIRESYKKANEKDNNRNKN